MPKPFKNLVEISNARQIARLPADEYAGLIGHARDFVIGDDGHEAEHSARFVWLTDASEADLNAGAFKLPPHTGLAVTAPRGTFDIDRISTALRVYEARTGREDGSITLLVFLFSTIASLADGGMKISPCHRIKALALDEGALAASLGSDGNYRQDAAPLIFARARLVAHARQLGVPAYLKPISEKDRDLARVAEHAARDGFDGLIVQAAD